MSFRSSKKWLWAAPVAVALILGACSAPYVAAQNGKCAFGRTWVAPTKDAKGIWKDGYCKDADK